MSWRKTLTEKVLGRKHKKGITPPGGKFKPPLRAKGHYVKPWTLGEEEKQIVVRFIAQGLTTAEVIDEAHQLGIDVSGPQISTYKVSDKWKPLIRKWREEHLAHISDIAGANKSVRLHRADKVYAKAVEKNDLKHQLAAIEHSRKEMEDKAVQGGNFIFQQYNNLSKEELDEKIQTTMKRIEQITKKEKPDGPDRTTEVKEG